MARNDSTIRTSSADLWIRALTKSELHELIADVQRGFPDATSRAIIFVASESFGMWHNRARAKLCRFFKNHPPSDDACKQMVDAIANRLTDGRFSEQFKDQLAMAIRFAPDRMASAEVVASQSAKAYIRRYATWVRLVLNSTGTKPTGE